MAIWGLIGILLPFNRLTGQNLLLITCFLIVAAGVVMASRLKLNAHTPREILTGALTGFVIGFCGMVLLF
jgi:membrane-associated phospholipid phosphatase